MIQRKVHFVNSAGATWPWARQIPGAGTTWGQTLYAIDVEPAFVPDWLVVYEGWLPVELATRVPRERRILICAEPESFHRYQPKFLAQFGHVITSQSRVRHPGVIASQVAINWFAGVRFNGVSGPHTPVLKFEDFVSGNPPKTKLCSVVCSTKTVTKGHRQRLAFVERLKRELGDQIDVYGRGFREIRDKDEALADYRYHIALENSSHQDYWTEKLADPFLRGCFPIYAGCPNLSEYFPDGSYVRIDIGKPDQALETILTVLASSKDRDGSNDLPGAKRRVLWEHNVFALLERTFQRLEQIQNSAPVIGAEVRLITDQEAKNMRISRRVTRYLREALGRQR